MSEQQHENEGQGHEKKFTLIVNGRPKEWEKPLISYTEAVALAGYTPSPNTIFTVTYRRGVDNQEGSLVEGGEPVQVKSGMIFNVVASDKS